MPPRARKLSEADQADWAAYTSRITPLKGRASPPLPPQEPAGKPLTPAAILPPRPKPAVVERAARERPRPVGVGNQPGGIDTGTWERFRTGKLPSVRTLDLHGQTAQRAFYQLLAFIRAAHSDRVRCVEIVTGRGSGENGGVIRRELPMWLNLPELRPLVLAAAHPHAANPGSVRVLLRRVR